MKKRILCLLLALSLCLVLVLASCKRNPENPDDPSGPAQGDTLPGEKKGNVYSTPYAGGDAKPNEPNEEVEDGTVRYGEN